MDFKIVLKIESANRTICSNCPAHRNTATCFAFNKIRILDKSLNDFCRLPECRDAENQYWEELCKDRGEISDGAHTFNELYEFRKLYNAALFNEWAKAGKYDVHKSLRHNEGEECFGGGWFIVVAMLPTGQISNHYKIEDWDLFDIPEHNVAKHPYDGHTAHDVTVRLKQLLQEKENA